jgi:outer membrane lipoprotein-sorting protein
MPLPYGIIVPVFAGFHEMDFPTIVKLFHALTVRSDMSLKSACMIVLGDESIYDILYQRMNPVRKTLFFSVLYLVSALFIAGAGTEEVPDVSTIVDKVDRLYRSKSSQGRMKMTIVSRNWTRTLKMNVWSEGMEKTFIHITHPKKDAGIATLRIKNEMWNYFPKINKVMKIPPSMMMSSWMGSDFTNDDIVKESSMLRDYSHALVEPDESEAGVYYIELIPKENVPTVWAKIVLHVRKDDYIPVQEEYFDEKGNKMRIIEFKEIRSFGNRQIPSVLELTPLNKKGEKTVVTYVDLKFDEGLDTDVFTLRNLQKRR